MLAPDVVHSPPEVISSDGDPLEALIREKPLDEVTWLSTPPEATADAPTKLRVVLVPVPSTSRVWVPELALPTSSVSAEPDPERSTV